MPLIFPHMNHIALSRSPLSEVVCQLRFPFDLAIAEKKPIELQKVLRPQFPILKLIHEFEATIPPNRDSISTASRPTSYSFEDNLGYRAVLAPDFFALQATRYEGWEKFYSRFEFVCKSILDIYELTLATRLGLRYVNILTPKNTNTNEIKDIVSLIKDEIAISLDESKVGPLQQGFVRINLEDDADTFTLTSGIVLDQSSKERVFVLDFDHYTESNLELELGHTLDKVQYYHQSIYNAFRWCIKPDLFNRFQE